MKIDFTRFYELLNEVFWDFFEDKSRIRISFGGGGSGKSVEAFQECIYKIVSEPGHNYLVCRKVASTNKTSTFALFQQLISNLALNDDPDVENIDISRFFKINKTDLSITYKGNGNMVIFKGLDDVEKVKSLTFPSGVLTDIIVEEASEITQKDFDQLNVRLRGKARVPFQITLLLNPISDKHWIKKEFFDLRSYQKKHKVTILKTTYLDNEFIDENYKDVLEGYKDIDYEFYRVYCLGEWGSFGNIIFNNWTALECPYKEEEFDAIYCGMDFGFDHPSMIVKIGFKDGAMYTYDELCVEQKTNKEFIQANEEFDILHKGEAARADSAEPARIKEWQQHGYGVIPAIKGKDSVSRGIDFLKSQRWYIDPKRCIRTLQEVEVYHKKTDKDGNVLPGENPVEIFDDAIKSHMYALEPLSRSLGKPGVLSGTLTDQKKDLIQVKKAERKKKKEILIAQRKRRKEMEKK